MISASADGEIAGGEVLGSGRGGELGNISTFEFIIGPDVVLESDVQFGLHIGVLVFVEVDIIGDFVPVSLLLAQVSGPVSRVDLLNNFLEIDAFFDVTAEVIGFTVVIIGEVYVSNAVIEVKNLLNINGLSLIGDAASELLFVESSININLESQVVVRGETIGGCVVCVESKGLGEAVGDVDGSGSLSLSQGLGSENVASLDHVQGSSDGLASDQ